MNSVRVLVRCYGDEPAVLNAIGRDYKSVAVARGEPDKHTSMGWWRDQLFVPDDELIASIKSALESGDSETVKKLWRRAEPIQLPDEDECRVKFEQKRRETKRERMERLREKWQRKANELDEKLRNAHP